MANSDAASGLSPVAYLNGAPYNGQARRYYVPAAEATALHIGDVVKLAGSADATAKYASVVIAASGDVFVGVIVAVELVTQASTIYREALTERYVMVADDPQLIFEAQLTGTIAATDVGSNAELSVAAGSDITGLSATEVTSTFATTAGHDTQILGIVDRPDNAIGTNAKVLVRLNKHQYTAGATGI